MLAAHTFRVVLVSKGHGVGIGESGTPDKAINYSGQKTSASF
jgi:hypothetical protein